MMKHLLSICMVAMIGISAQAQERFVRAGDKAYDGLAYARAITNYERASQAGVADSSYALKFAQSYLKVRDFRNAEKWYARVVRSPAARPVDQYNYAQALRANGKLAEADQWLKTYELKAAGDTRIDRQANATRYAKQLSERTIPGCTVKDLDVNTAGSDMGASFHGKDGVVFASNRAPDVAEFRRHTWNGQPFLDLYSATRTADGTINTPSAIASLNTKYHESNAIFSADGNSVYFTRNNYSKGHKGKTAQGVVNLKIYSRTWQNGSWVNEQAFAFNSDAYSVGHPCLGADANTIWFTSDMPGGMGGTDIWYCKKAGTVWEKPVNMGSTVNTEGNEMFPFMSANNNLFFASDGQQGLGGLDILLCRVDGSGHVGAPKNPGAPLNSDRDDFAVVFDATGLNGYFTSDRTGGKGDDDIYSIALTKPLGPSMRVEGIAMDWRTKVPMPGVAVEMKDTLGNVLASTVAGEGGSYSLDIEANEEYLLDGNLPNHRSGHAELWSGPEADTAFKRDLKLARYAAVTAWMHVTNARNGEALADVATQAIDVPGGNVEVIAGRTNITGDLRQALEDRALGDSLVFRVRLAKPGFFPKKGLFFYTVNDSGEVAMHQVMDLAMEPIEVGAEVGKAININPIYFDLGKWNIRRDAANELDKVVTVMNENPTMEVELGSHTDSRGGDRANMTLSDKRAKSSAAYIISKGIEKRRIKGKGYGETKLLNKCGNGAKCTEDEHQINRRTEFIITKM